MFGMITRTAQHTTLVDDNIDIRTTNDDEISRFVKNEFKREPRSYKNFLEGNLRKDSK